MRDPKRIQPYMNRLSTVWSTLPDLRFGQLMYNVFQYISELGLDPFYVEDEAMFHYVEQFLSE